jgi:uncharacterized protein (TIGR03083 family)
MTLSVDRCVEAITTHSRGFAEAARAADLRARVDSCPGWDVADLVWHLTDVHWFWATIVEGRLPERPDEALRPPRRPDGELVDTFEAAAAHLAEVLSTPDQDAHCWTWATWQQNVAFVTRHQVQEAAVHHWDAANAAGLTMSIAPDVAADCVEEFLDFSIPNPVDPDDPPGGTLDGELVLRATDTGQAWRIRDDARVGTLHWSPDSSSDPAVEGSASDMILWLYSRVDLPVPDEALVSRFRALSFTD